MTTRRTAVALLAVAILSVAGCHSSGSGSDDPSADAASRQALLASVTALATTTYAVTLTTPHLTAIGTVDPIADCETVTAKAVRDGSPVTIRDLTIDGTSWVKIDAGVDNPDLGIDPDKWLKLDAGLLSAGSLPYDQARFPDAFDLSNILGGIISASNSSSGHYSGRIDLTGVAGVASMVPAGSGLGAAGANLPFTATLDAQGRLTELKVGGSGSTPTFDFGISDYSATTAVDPPNDDDVMTAPATAYGLLRGDRMTQ